jgi:hypothetical protein
MMVGGATSVIVIGAGTYIFESFFAHGRGHTEILLWLVIGQSAPVLFGATSLLMHAVDRGAFHEVLIGLTAAFFLAGILISGADNAVLIAQTFAAAQLTQSALCAVLLTHCGVWPGLTALLHRDIKLF